MSGIARVLGRLLVNHRARANLVPDVHLTGLAVEHRLVPCSTDANFASISGLPWQDPLSDPGQSG